MCGYISIPHKEKQLFSFFKDFKQLEPKKHEKTRKNRRNTEKYLPILKKMVYNVGCHGISACRAGIRKVI